MIWMLIMMKWFSLYDLDTLRYIFGLRCNTLGYLKGNILHSCICNSLMPAHEISYHNSNAMIWDNVSCNYVNVILDIMKCKFVIHVILNVLRCNNL